MNILENLGHLPNFVVGLLFLISGASNITMFYNLVFSDVLYLWFNFTLTNVWLFLCVLACCRPRYHHLTHTTIRLNQTIFG